MRDSASPRTEEELHQLIEQTRQGNRNAFDQVIEHYTPDLKRTIQHWLGSRPDHKLSVDDLAQETFLSAWVDLNKFQWHNEKAFWFWLKAIARHLMYAEIRKLSCQKRKRREMSLQEKTRGSSDDALDELVRFLEADTVTPSHDLRRHERFDRLQSAMENLNSDTRKIVFLTRICGIPVKEVARRLGFSRPAVSMALARALRQLKGAIGATESLSLPQRCLNAH